MTDLPPNEDSAEEMEDVEEAAVEEPVEEPAEEEASDDGSVQSVSDGFYWVRAGDSAWTASERIYGSADPSKLQPTIPASPGFQASGHLIRTPGVAGKVTSVRPFEDSTAVLRRMGFTTGKKNLSKFQAFNGGDTRMLNPGVLVFMPGGD